MRHGPLRAALDWVVLLLVIVAVYLVVPVAV